MNDGWGSDFSFDYFRKILRAVKSNFELYMISEAPNIFNTSKRPKIMLRHDIDVSLEGAMKMAEIENALGIRSTYMVMTKSALYDIQEKDSRDILLKIIEMGHEIGLHHNKEEIRSSKEQLENITGMPVLSISPHRPMQMISRDPFTMFGMINTHAKELMDWYLSDSRGKWRNGEPLPKLSNPDRPLLQLLMHPIWWGDTHMSPENRLQEFFDGKIQGRSFRYIKKLDEAIFDVTDVKHKEVK